MINPFTDLDWLAGVLNKLKWRIFRDLEVQLPCVVTVVHSRNLVSVKPLISKINSDGNRESRKEITHVQVETQGAGNILISHPVAVGSLGWIHASDRDISLFLQGYSENQPGTRRMHSFSDAKFVPDVMTNFTVAEEDATATVIQNRDGTVKIAVDETEIRLTSGTVEILIDGSAVTGIAPGGFNFNGFIIGSDGELQTPTGLTSGAGDITTVTGNSIDGHDHDVINVQSGNDTITTTETNI